MALLMVITAVAMLTAVAVEFSYRSRVESRLAVNARDQLRAYYLARSAVNLSRLVLHFQKQVDSIQIPNLSGLLSGALGQGLAGGTPPATPGAAAPAAPATPATPTSGGLHIRLWNIIPVDSGALQLFIGPSLAPLTSESTPMTPTPNPSPAYGSTPTPGAPGVGLPASAPLGPGSAQATEPLGPISPSGTEYRLKSLSRSFGDFDGSFHADVTDEESKINVNALNQLSALSAATSTEMLTLMHAKDQKYDFLFDDLDETHHQVHREDLLANLHDWVDTDSTTAVFNPLALASFSDPFTAGFGDEDEWYQRQDPRYRAKNAPIDTIQELFLIHGITDRFMAAFGDHLTVFSPPNALLNINTNDPVQQVTNILVALDTTQHPEVVPQLLGNPLLLNSILAQIQMMRMYSFVGMSVQSFVRVLVSNHLPVRPELTVANSPNAFLGDTSSTFTIKAVGQAGEVESHLTAVVRADDNLGKLLYWREE